MPTLNLNITKTLISDKTLVTADDLDHVLIGDASDSDNLKKVLVSDFLGGGTDTVLLVYESVVNQNMADSTSYYMGRNNTFGLNENQAKMFSIPAGKIIAAQISKYIGSTFPTSGDVALVLVTDVGGTDQNDDIITDLNFQASLPRNAEEPKITLDIDVLEGMSYIRIDTPVWATNPNGANFIVTLTMQPT